MSDPTQRPPGGPGEPSGPPSGGGPERDAAWRAWQVEVVAAVSALADGASLGLAATEAEARPVLLRRSHLGGFIPAKHEVLAPWVRLVRVEDHLRGHCVGAASFGGPFPFSPEEDAALLALGWHHPGHGDGDHYVRYFPDDVPQGPFIPRDEAERAAGMVAATFREVLLGGDTPGLPAITRD